MHKNLGRELLPLLRKGGRRQAIIRDPRSSCKAYGLASIAWSIECLAAPGPHASAGSGSCHRIAGNQNLLVHLDGAITSAQCKTATSPVNNRVLSLRTTWGLRRDDSRRTTLLIILVRSAPMFSRSFPSTSVHHFRGPCPACHGFHRLL